MELWSRHDAAAAVPDEAAITRARRYVGWSKVQRDAGRVFLPEPGMSLDFGGIGREYAADAVAAMIHRAGGMSVLVDFGQDVVALGPPPDGQPA